MVKYCWREGSRVSKCLHLYMHVVNADLPILWTGLLIYLYNKPQYRVQPVSRNDLHYYGNIMIFCAPAPPRACSWPSSSASSTARSLRWSNGSGVSIAWWKMAVVSGPCVRRLPARSWSKSPGSRWNPGQPARTLWRISPRLTTACCPEGKPGGQGRTRRRRERRIRLFWRLFAPTAPAPIECDTYTGCGISSHFAETLSRCNKDMTGHAFA